MLHIRHQEIMASYKRQIQGVKAGNSLRKGKITAEMYFAEKALTRLIGHEPASEWVRINKNVVKRTN